MGAIWACLAAKLTSSGAMLEVEGNSVALECCNCEERSNSNSSDSPRRKDEPPPKESTDVTAIPSDLQSTPRTMPPAELFQGAPEVTVVKINV